MGWVWHGLIVEGVCWHYSTPQQAPSHHIAAQHSAAPSRAHIQIRHAQVAPDSNALAVEAITHTAAQSARHTATAQDIVAHSSAARHSTPHSHSTALTVEVVR